MPTSSTSGVTEERWVSAPRGVLMERGVGRLPRRSERPSRSCSGVLTRRAMRSVVRPTHDLRRTIDLETDFAMPRRVAALLHLGTLEGGNAARLGQADVGVAADGQFAAPAAVPVAQDPAGHAGGREREREAVAVGLGRRLAGLDPVPELQVRQVTLVPCHAHPRCSDVGRIAATRLGVCAAEVQGESRSGVFGCGYYRRARFSVEAVLALAVRALEGASSPSSGL